MTAGWRLFNSTVGSNPTSSADPRTDGLKPTKLPLRIA